jgi:hypothetical protein
MGPLSHTVGDEYVALMDMLNLNSIIYHCIVKSDSSGNELSAYITISTYIHFITSIYFLIFLLKQFILLLISR